MQLRLQHERIEGLVDDVVQGYHSGFNQAIHNYSRILDLFTTAQEEVILQRLCLARPGVVPM